MEKGSGEHCSFLVELQKALQKGVFSIVSSCAYGYLFMDFVNAWFQDMCNALGLSNLTIGFQEAESNNLYGINDSTPKNRPES